MRPVTCKVCGEPFAKQRIGQKTCSVKCAIELGKVVAEKMKQAAKRVERRETKKKLDALKTRSDWLKDAQVVFNRWVRLRDAGQPCISCGRNTGAKMNAGHYRSVGACPELRFQPMNVHLQCEHCNSYLSGNAIEYRKRLIDRIGIQNVEWLEGPHEPIKLTIDDIKRIIVEYKDKIRNV